MRKMTTNICDHTPMVYQAMLELNCEFKGFYLNYKI